mgnify:CR=1 FL=1
MAGALTVINRLIGIRVLVTPVIILGNTHNIWVLWRPTMPTQLDYLAIMMKKGIGKIPLIGTACKYAHHIFVDKSGPSKIRATYDQARSILKEGMSLVVFPEGARTFTGHMGVFRRGAFMLADDLQLPVVPLTINGSFDVKPRTKDKYWVFWHPIKLTIHKPIAPIGKCPENIKNQMEKSYEAVMSAISPEYQGFVENPDQ